MLLKTEMILFLVFLDTFQGSQLDENNSSTTENLDLIFNPSLGLQRSLKELEMKNEFNLDFGSTDLKESYYNLFEILWYSQLPCFDVMNVTSKVNYEMGMIKSCSWKGQMMNCASLFSMMPTDKGMCCTFNKEKAEEMFLEGTFSEQITKMQGKDKDGAFEEAKLSQLYLTNNEPISYPGTDNGLRLVLDSHSDRLSSGSIGDMFRGFLVLIEGSNVFPQASRSSFVLRPGNENDVVLSASQIYGGKGTKETKPNDRSCYFSDEYSLESFKKYSKDNCILECSIEYARNQMKNETRVDGCIPWFYPPMSNSSSYVWCNPWETEEFIMNQKLVPINECSHCLPDCNSTEYEATITSAPLRKCDRTNLGTSNLCNFKKSYVHPPMWAEQIEQEYLLSMGNVPEYIKSGDSEMTNVRGENVLEEDSEGSGDKPIYDAFEQDIAVVNFYFSKSTIIQFKRVGRLSWIEYLCQIGGILGLALGISIISGVELIYWITIRLIRNMQSMKETRRYKKEKEYQRKYSAVERHQKMVALTKQKDENNELLL